jgi:hypothetical protein
LQIGFAHPPFVQRGRDQGACCAHGFERGQIDGVAYAGIDFPLTGDRQDRGKPREIGLAPLPTRSRVMAITWRGQSPGSDRISAWP